MNEDGYVTWAEHIKDNFDIDNEFTELVTDPENQQMMAEDRVLWAAADVDGDRALSKKEFPAFNAPEEYDHMHDHVYELTMKRRDKNNDGYLDIFEFLVDDNGQVSHSRVVLSLMSICSRCLIKILKPMSPRKTVLKKIMTKTRMES